MRITHLETAAHHDVVPVVVPVAVVVIVAVPVLLRHLELGVQVVRLVGDPGRFSLGPLLPDRVGGRLLGRGDRDMSAVRHEGGNLGLLGRGCGQSGGSCAFGLLLGDELDMLLLGWTLCLAGDAFR